MDQEPFPLHRVFNQFEAGFWFVIALILALFYRRRLTLPWRWLLPLAFALFGVSDVIEAGSGAWWRPWWLLVMKAACVLVFLMALRAHLRQVKANGTRSPGTDPAPRTDSTASPQRGTDPGRPGK